MAAEKSSEGARDQCGQDNRVFKSKRRRFQDDDDCEDVNCDLKDLFAKELSNYLDRTIEEVVISETDDEQRYLKKEEQPNDFQLFSNSQKVSSGTYSEDIQNCHQEHPKASLSSDDDEDEEDTARLKEAAISIEEIFGSKSNHHIRTLSKT